MTETHRRMLARAAPGIVAFILAYRIFRHGIDTFAIVSLLLYMFWSAGLWFVVTRSAGPVRTYGYLTLASSIVALLFIAAPAAEHGDPIIGAIAWAGVTILGLIWCIYYEQTTTR